MKKELLMKVLLSLQAEGKIAQVRFKSISGKGRPRIAWVATEHLKAAIAKGGVVIPA
jgi:hypothetical protein